MQIRIGVKKETTVSLARATGRSDDRFENSKFGVSLSEEYAFADAPEDTKEYAVWGEEKAKFFRDKTAELNAFAEAELQATIDQFMDDNKPGE